MALTNNSFFKITTDRDGLFANIKCFTSIIERDDDVRFELGANENFKCISV